MERYSNFRDKGSSIAPFFPIPSEPAGLNWPFHLLIFCIRLPLFLTLLISYFLIFRWLPGGSLGKKAFLWLVLGIPGIWWVDMQVDGVRRGSLAKHMNSLPQPGDIIAATFTSPLDALYLAAIFDPIFTASYPRTRKVLRLSLFGTYVQALRYPDETPPMPFQQYLTDLSSLARNNPHRIIVVFPECTTTNGKGILPFSPSLLSLPKNKRVFPLALRYAPADVTTPVSGARWTFLWNLLSSPTHTIRVRIASSTLKNTPARRGSLPTGSMMERDRASSPDSAATSSSDTLVEVGKDEEAMDREAAADQRFLDRLADDLARLQRVGRVGLTLSDKAAFVDSWTKYH